MEARILVALVMFGFFCGALALVGAFGDWLHRKMNGVE